jgi:4-hydroxy-4-methyl-2-oxoglutarate aldolase
VSGFQASVTDDLIVRASTRSSATLHEAAGRTGALPSSIRPLSFDVCVCGRAYPVRSPPGDNLWLHHAISAADAGDVLVVDVGGASEYGYWGEVMAVAAQKRGVVGLVINGGVRDVQQMLDMHFPVFSTTPCIRGTGKDPRGNGSLGAPVTIGDVTIARGDLVRGDSDGVVVLPTATAAQIVGDGERRDAAEMEILSRLRKGETTVAIYSLPAPVALHAKA